MAIGRAYDHGAATYAADQARVYEQGAEIVSSDKARVYEHGASATVLTGVLARVYDHGAKVDVAHHMLLLSDGEWHEATLTRATATSWI